LRANRLQEFLLANAKPLLFIDDDEAEILKIDVFLDEAVRTDDDIDAAVLQTLDGLRLLFLGTQPGHHLNVDRECRHTLSEGLKMLQRENGCRDKDCNLLAGVGRLERCANCDLGLAETDISAHKAIHRPVGFHVVLDRVDRQGLILRFDKGEGFR